MSHQFYVTLPSDSSFAYYSDNTAAKYITKLTEELSLDGSYEVGLAEICYTKSLFNFDNSKGHHWLEVRAARTGKLTKCTFRSGFYATTEDFVNDLNKQMDDTFGKNENYKISFQVDKTSGLIALSLYKKHDYIITFEWSEPFQRLIGYGAEYWPPNESGLYPASKRLDLNDGLRFMYVYCDIVSHTLVGDTKAPLLRVFPLRGNYGDVIQETFNDIHYVPVQKRHFDSIELSINTETGQIMPFQFGKSIVTLHFRRTYSIPEK